ncbi:hypothetical protein VVR12_01870 [Rothia sp. LK2588]|uniref:hypothetical protein n=1 Tax=Rothia sp. LK2588 TaxID=3114369 RepID=UPI0034CDC0CA
MPPLDQLPSNTPWWVYLLAFIVFGGSGAKMWTGIRSIYTGHAEAERQRVREAVADKETVISRLVDDVARLKEDVEDLRDELDQAREKEKDTARSLRILEEAHSALRRLFIEKVGCEEELPPWPKY